MTYLPQIFWPIVAFGIYWLNKCIECFLLIVILQCISYFIFIAPLQSEVLTNYKLSKLECSKSGVAAVFSRNNKLVSGNFNAIKSDKLMKLLFQKALQHRNNFYLYVRYILGNHWHLIPPDNKTVPPCVFKTTSLCMYTNNILK